MEMQHALGADIIMAFDECPPGQSSREVATRRTSARCAGWSAAAAASPSCRRSTARRSGRRCCPSCRGVYADLRRRGPPHAGRRRLARHRHRRAVRGRAEAAHVRDARGAAAGAAAAAAALPDGRRLPGRPGGGDPARGRHVRLRGAHAQRPQRHGVGRGGGAGEHRRRRASAPTSGRWTRTCDCYTCRDVHAGVPAAPGRRRTSSSACGCCRCTTCGSWCGSRSRRAQAIRDGRLESWADDWLRRFRGKAAGEDLR
jgi:hypothetical protein